MIGENTEVDSISLSAPTLPLGVEMQDPRSRTATVRDAKHGTDILNK